MIKPHIIKQKLAGKIIEIILQEGYEISAMQSFFLDRPTSEEFLDLYKVNHFIWKNDEIKDLLFKIKGSIARFYLSCRSLIKWFMHCFRSEIRKCSLKF